MTNRKIGRLHPLLEPVLYRDEITLLAAAPYTGKSRFCLRLATQLAQGQPTVFGQMEPIKVLYCSERNWNFTTDQFSKETGLTTIPDNLEFFCAQDVKDAKFPMFNLRPLTYVEEQMFVNGYKPDLAILDTFIDFHTTEAKNKTTDYGANRASIMKIQRWAMKHHMAILALAHSPKENENTRYRNPIQRVLGSTSITAVTSAVFIMEHIDFKTRKYISLYQEAHHGMIDPPYRYFTRDDFSEVTEDEAHAKSGSGPKAMALTGREVDVLNLIPMDWHNYHETFDKIQSNLEMSSSNILNYFKKLVNKSQIAIDNNPDDPANKMIRRFQPN